MAWDYCQCSFPGKRPRLSYRIGPGAWMASGGIGLMLFCLFVCVIIGMDMALCVLEVSNPNQVWQPAALLLIILFVWNSLEQFVWHFYFFVQIQGRCEFLYPNNFLFFWHSFEVYNAPFWYSFWTCLVNSWSAMTIPWTNRSSTRALQDGPAQ